MTSRVKTKYKLVEIDPTSRTLTLQRKGSQIIINDPEIADPVKLIRDPDVPAWYLDIDTYGSLSFGEPPLIEDALDTMVKAYIAQYPVELEVSFIKRYGSEEKYMVHTVIVGKKPEKRETSIDISDIKITPIDYVRLRLGVKGYIYIQADGYLLYAGQSGEGKTYFAIDNIPHLVEKFGTVVILAYEITPLDYLVRLASMLRKTPEQVQKEYKGKIIIETEIDMAKLKHKYSKKHYKNLAFIVDNVDNLPLEMQGEHHYQSRWLKQFDNFMKENGFFSIVLSQMKKMQEKTKKEDLTQYDVAGSKDRIDLSRSAIFTWFDEETKIYMYKALKLGSMKRDSDIKWVYPK